MLSFFCPPTAAPLIADSPLFFTIGLTLGALAWQALWHCAHDAEQTADRHGRLLQEVRAELKACRQDRTAAAAGSSSSGLI